MTPIVFFNICWMKEYKGITENDKPIKGGRFVEEEGFGGEIYNFQPFKGRCYGFVEAGYKPHPRCINITRLGASTTASSVPGILVIWVARHPDEKRTVVVGWYKDATVHRARQPSPVGSNRRLPNGEQAEYFVVTEEQNCKLVPAYNRNRDIPRGAQGLGQKNVWYAERPLGSKVKTSICEYISNYGINK